MPDLIITGISRSGTSFLCNQLHRYSNCVIVNEPREVFKSLRNEDIPWGVADFYRQLRADVAEGRPIENKLRDGQVTEDTAVSGERVLYTPSVDSDDFVLGTKNTLWYLSRLDALRKALPQARVVACVRDPFDTIASWKRSFPHLAEVKDPLVENTQWPWLSDRRRAAISRIQSVDDLAKRRAMWWSYLAELIIDQAEGLILVSYATLVRDPEAVVEEILEGYPKGRLREPLLASVERSDRSILDESDEQAIHSICSKAAADLGV